MTESYQKMSLEDSDIFDSLNFMNHGLSESEMQHTAEQILKDPACGTVLRIKGFCQKEDKTWVELNATHHETLLRKTEAGQEVLIVIGQRLNEERIRQYHCINQRVTDNSIRRNIMKKISEFCLQIWMEHF